MFFFFNDTATTEIYTLSLRDALPISPPSPRSQRAGPGRAGRSCRRAGPHRRSAVSGTTRRTATRSEEHTSELQSRQYLVCRLLLEKKRHVPGSLTTTRLHSSPSTTSS